MRGAHNVVPTVLEGGVQEEAIVFELEMFAVVANATLAQGDQLLALGESADGDRPFLEGNWHRKGDEERGMT